MLLNARRYFTTLKLFKNINVAYIGDRFVLFDRTEKEYKKTE